MKLVLGKNGNGINGRFQHEDYGFMASFVFNYAAKIVSAFLTERTLMISYYSLTVFLIVTN